MTFSEKMKYLRDKKGKTQQQASDEMGIAISSLRNYENGRLPDTVQLKRIKDYYDVTYEYLLDDNCENKTAETLDIGKKLNLSDKSIKHLKETEEKEILNKFIEYYQFSDFIKNLNLYYKINYIITYDLQLFIYICDLWEYIIDRNIKGHTDDLKDYFNKCDKAIDNIINFTNGTNFFDPSDSKYDLFREHYENLKDFIFVQSLKNKKMKESVQFELETVIDLFDEINSKYIMYSRILKLNISDILNNFLITIEKMYNITLGSEDYTNMFGKYIKHINSDIKDDYNFCSQMFKKRNNLNSII